MFFLVLLSALLACTAGAHLDTTKSQPNGRIVGGNTTTINSYPHQVSVRYLGSHVCGGSIISPNWVVTAAHCIFETSAYSFSVRAGSAYSNSGGTVHSVTRIIRHESYNSNTHDYDVALVQVTPNFTYTASVKHIPLECNSVPVGTEAVVTGFGLTAEGGSASTNLRAVAVKVIRDDVCNSNYSDRGGITARMICAGVTSGEKDACEGDNGGPLVVGNRLVGIVSWGVGCARVEYPRVYTDVSAVCCWIKDYVDI